MAAQFTIGIDLGGTNIKSGLLDAQGNLVYRTSIATEAEHGFEHVFARLVKLVDQIITEAGVARSDVTGIGYGTPGPMSHAEGIIHASPNLPGWVNIPMRKRFSEATGLPVTLENDANVAAYGEFIAGAGRGLLHVVMFTLGTGVGGGVVSNGQLNRGGFENAGELGHTIVVPNGRPCPCGQKGCLERYSSANAVAERFVEALQAGEQSPLRERVDAGEALTSADIVKAAEAGDALAARIWQETCFYLAVACVNVQHTLNPERVVLGGGLINAGACLLDQVRAEMAGLVWNIAQDGPEITFATLGDNAGVIGAAALAREAASMG